MNHYSYLPIDVGFDLRMQGTAIVTAAIQPDSKGLVSVSYEDPKHRQVTLRDVTPDVAADALRAAGYNVE